MVFSFSNKRPKRRCPAGDFAAIMLFYGVVFTLPAAAQESGTERDKRIYNLSELLEKAERIVVGTIAKPKDGSLNIIVKETLKAPELAGGKASPERLKRAADLLADDKNDKQDATASLPAAPTPVNIVIDKSTVIVLQEGQEALFFLWDKAEKHAGAYRLSHPQCVYDAQFVSQVKNGLARPRSVADGRYLRDWDAKMAQRVAQRAEDGKLIASKGGEVVMGLRIQALRPILSTRSDNSFGLAARIENTRSRPQTIYNGPAGGYGVRIRPKEGEPVILRQKMIGLDESVLKIPEPTDFSSIGGQEWLAKDLFFDATDYPVLKSISGDCHVSVFFVTAQDGKDLELGGEPIFTGTLISPETPFHFGTFKAK